MFHAGLNEILRTLDERPTPGAYKQAARALRALPDLEFSELRVALLASFTIDPLVPFLEVEAARHGRRANIYVGPFNAVGQQLIDPAGGCHGHQPHIVFVAQRLEELAPALCDGFLVLNRSQVDAAVDECVGSIVAALTAFRQSSDAPVVVHNYALPASPMLGLYEPSVADSQTDAVRRLNTALVRALARLPAVSVFDFDRLCAEVGYRHAVDRKLWYLARAPLSAQMLPELAAALAAFSNMLLGTPRKCVVVDLDNTLWGGVVGESGPSGVSLGPSFPGNAFVDVQRALLRLKHRGVLLAINSKNNRADAEEVFARHPEMVLTLDDFVCTRINWSEKPENMIDIARELGVGLDSLVFVDDNPGERDLMRRAFPEVLTLELPADPIDYPNTLLQCRAFDRLSLTAEDRSRSDMYRTEATRREFSQSFSSLADFLSALQMQATVAVVDQWSAPRVVDLLHKTNQFNLTTRRHSAAALGRMMNDPDCRVVSLRVVDRFGDNGLVGVAILKVDGAIAEIDTFLLSCRVIGRRLETALLSTLVDDARACGASTLEGNFIPSAKNVPAANFFQAHGFTRVSSAIDDTRWRLPLDQVTFEWPAHVGRGRDVVVTPEAGAAWSTHDVAAS
jgi:FkbH-like protein